MVITIILIIAYYLVGWILLAGMYKKLDRIKWWVYPGVLTFFGLWFTWFAAYFLHQFVNTEHKIVKNNFTIVVRRARVADTDGIVFSTDGYGNSKRFVFYNFSKEDYAGCIEIDTKSANTETVKKIVQRLNEWGEKEKEKKCLYKSMCRD
jgi:hypothetical protein